MIAETADQVPPGEAGFQLLADELPDLIIVAFDPQLMMWAATGGGLHGHGWTAEDFVGLKLPRIAGSSQAEAVEACARAALGGLCTELEMNGYEDPRRLWSITFVPLADAAGVVSGGMALCRDITEERRGRAAPAGQPAPARRGRADRRGRELGLGPGHRRAGLVRRAGPDAYRPGPLLLRASDRAHRRHRRHGHGPRRGVVGEDGQVERFIGTGQDITERRRADAERRRLLNRVYETQEGQDRRLAADLHDGHVQSLAAIGFKLEQARLRLGASGSPQVDELLWQVTKDLSAEATSLRRTIGRLRPLVAIECSSRGVTLWVSDDGRGFDPDHVRVLADIAHFGLIAMRERVEALGGRFRVITTPGDGTVVEAKLPLIDPIERWEP